MKTKLICFALLAGSLSFADQVIIPPGVIAVAPLVPDALVVAVGDNLVAPGPIFCDDLVLICRKVTNPLQVSLYLLAPTNGISLTQNVPYKLNVAVIPATLPFGFDMYITPQGPAIRFVGTDGDPTGTETNTIQVVAHMSIKAETGKTTAEFSGRSRNYTEGSFTNSVNIPGFILSRTLANNEVGSFAIVAPLVTIVDGDLLELAITLSSTETINIEALSFTAIEVK